jgi:hypothetical protein
VRIDLSIDQGAVHGGIPAFARPTPHTYRDDLGIWLRPESWANPNRLLHTEDFEDAVWLNTLTSLTPGQEDPYGGTSAALIQGDGAGDYLIQPAQGFAALTDDTASVWIKAGPGHNGTSAFRLYFLAGATSSYIDVVPTSEWQRIQINHTHDAAPAYARIGLYPDWSTGTESVYVAFPQLEAGTAASIYRANDASAGGLPGTLQDYGQYGTTYDQATAASRARVVTAVDGWYGLEFDGTDDRYELNTAGVTTWGGNSGYESLFVAKGLDSSSNVITSGVMSINWTADDFYAEGNYTTDGDAAPSGQWLVLSTLKATNLNMYSAVNGVPTTFGSPTGGSTAQTPQWLGSSGGATYADIILVEMIMFTRILTDVERTHMYNYLKWRYPSIPITVP